MEFWRVRQSSRRAEVLVADRHPNLHTLTGKHLRHGWRCSEWHAGRIGDMEDMAGVPADSESVPSADLVLLVRQGAFGLPTACPACLPAYIYLKLAAISFEPQFTAVEPDSEDLPLLEYGDRVGFASDNGGIVEFLRSEKIVDLDAGLDENEKAELETCKAMMGSWVADASAYELWMRDNDRAAKAVYFSELPIALVHALDWKQRLAVMQRLGITPENVTARSEDIFRKASNAYSALSVLLDDHKFFFNGRPTSLDALVLGHLLFHLRVPFELSTLKGEILKHENLVNYVEELSKELLGGGETSPDSEFFPKAPPAPIRIKKAAKVTPPKPVRTEKDTRMRKRAKYFIITQLVAVLMYVVFAGIEVEESGDGAGEDDEGSFDE